MTQQDLSNSKISQVVKEIEKEVLFYAKLNDEESMSEAGINSLEIIFALSNEILLQKNANELILPIFTNFLTAKNNVAFDVFNNVLQELCFSDLDLKDEPHTLMFINVAYSDIANKNHQGANVNLDGFQEIISAGLFYSSIVTGIDNVKVSKVIIPANQIKDISLKTWYDFTGEFMENPNATLNFTPDYSKMNTEPVKSFYLPVLIKGEHDELLELLYEKSVEVEEKIDEAAESILKGSAIVFSYLMPYSDADEETPQNLINGGKLMSFLDFIEKEKTPTSEFSLLDVEGDDKSVVVLALDSHDHTVSGFLILKNITDKLPIWEELSSFSTRNKIKFLMSEKKLASKIIYEIENADAEAPSSLSPQSEEQLRSVFEHSYDVDSNYLYLLATGGATQTIH